LDAFSGPISAWLPKFALENRRRVEFYDISRWVNAMQLLHLILRKTEPLFDGFDPRLPLMNLTGTINSPLGPLAA